MYIIAIGVIAAAVLVYFSFFTGKTADNLQPELVEEALEDIAVTATVNAKTVESNPARRQSRLKYFVIFTLDNGEHLEFSVKPEIFKALKAGDRDTLVYHDDVFIGFGDIGAVADSAETSEDFSETDDGFTLDDYDESIDIEIAADTDAANQVKINEEDLEDYKLFNEREKLQLKTEAIAVETESYMDYQAENLLDKITVYPFLKRENEVRRMFVKTYSEAVKDLLGYEGDSRTGRSADSVFVNRNEIRVAITIVEKPLPLLTHIEAEFGVNE